MSTPAYSTSSATNPQQQIGPHRALRTEPTCAPDPTPEPSVPLYRMRNFHGLVCCHCYGRQSVVEGVPTMSPLLPEAVTGTRYQQAAFQSPLL